MENGLIQVDAKLPIGQQRALVGVIVSAFVLSGCAPGVIDVIGESLIRAGVGAGVGAAALAIAIRTLPEDFHKFQGTAVLVGGGIGLLVGPWVEGICLTGVGTLELLMGIKFLLGDFTDKTIE